VRHLGVIAVTSVALSACALKGDVRRVEQEVQELRAEMARADSAWADFFDLAFQQMMALQGQIMDSLEARERRFASFSGTVSSDMTEVQLQLMQIQELTGQSQARLAELQRRLDERDTRPLVAQATGDSAGAGIAPAGAPSPNEIYDVAIQQLSRNSPLTARTAFQLLIEQYPDHSLAGDAQFNIGESWQNTEPDSAAAAYQLVVQNYPNSRRAPTALYRLGTIAEQRGDMEAARVYYQRVISGYPRSDEAELARAKLSPAH
jgi:tol-pal system protein YbgF